MTGRAWDSAARRKSNARSARQDRQIASGRTPGPAVGSAISLPGSAGAPHGQPTLSSSKSREAPLRSDGPLYTGSRRVSTGTWGFPTNRTARHGAPERAGRVAGAARHAPWRVPHGLSPIRSRGGCGEPRSLRGQVRAGPGDAPPGVLLGAHDGGAATPPPPADAPARSEIARSSPSARMGPVVRAAARACLPARSRNR